MSTSPSTSRNNEAQKRPDYTKLHPRNEAFVPEIQGKAKSGKKKANPIIEGTAGADMKLWHERPISSAYRELDNDLARDNLEGDIPFADLQDL